MDIKCKETKSVDTSVQINDNVDGGNENLGRDEHNDNPFKVFACGGKRVSLNQTTDGDKRRTYHVCDLAGLSKRPANHQQRSLSLATSSLSGPFPDMSGQLGRLGRVEAQPTLALERPEQILADGC